MNPLPPDADAPPLEPSDADVCARVLEGDVDSFELIMRRHNQRLFRLARSVVRDDAEAEDIVQETYVRAYASLAGFEHRAKLGTWLGRIALNEALGRRRRRSMGSSVDIDTLDEEEGERLLPMSSESPEKRVADEEMRPMLEGAIDSLPTIFRTVFILRAVEQLSVQETADMLAITPETVKTRFHRARGLLQKQLLARLDTAVGGVFPFLGTRCDRIVAVSLARIRESRLQ